MEFTIVNGIGLWNSWTRNFKTPLLACLDLLDNSFDAALCNDLTNASSLSNIPNHILAAPILSSSNGASNGNGGIKFEGKIHMQELEYESIYKNKPTPEKERKSGIRILNNSFKPINPLIEILEVYRSEKGKHTESVGENGVGLKQGCATLADLSFVISKNHKKKLLELGVIAASLQREEGVRLPSFQITYEMSDGNGVNLDSVRMGIQESTRDDEGVKACIKQLGIGNLQLGLDELTLHCKELLGDEWGDDAFCVILSDLRHGKPKVLLDEVWTEIPRNYIHVPSNFEFVIGGREVEFCFWQKRLIELSLFELKIDPKNAWNSYKKEEEHLWINPKEGYKLNLYFGFNPLRLEDHSACVMYVYSRQSGRLIKYSQDARAELGLSASGTDYSQGLTIIIDDFGGNLPLSPSKQDIAFGEEENGLAHKLNVLAWTSACTKLYWNHHAEKVNKSKTDLTLKVKAHKEDITRDINMTDKVELLPLGQLNLTKFHDMHWFKNHYKKISANVYVQNPYTVTPGPDTRFEITVARPVRKCEKISKISKKSRYVDDGPVPPTKKTRNSQKDKKKRRDQEQTQGYFISDDIQDWLKNARTKGNSKRSDSDLESDYDPTLYTPPLILPQGRLARPIQTSHNVVINGGLMHRPRRSNGVKKSAGTIQLQKRVKELQNEIAEVKSHTATERKLLENEYDAKGKEISALEHRLQNLDRMMKAMIDSAA